MSQLMCKNVTISYENDLALNQISFEIEAGDYICILGENGSGKSTLLKGILGLTPLKSGQVLFGEGLTSRAVGYLPQQTQVQKDFPATIHEVVLSGCLGRTGLKPFYTKKDYQCAEKNMKRLGIEAMKKRSYKALSGGQQQRVLLARALCASEKMLLLDEPITGLDPLMTDEFYKLIAELNRSTGISILMTSHDVETSLKYANKILHLQNEVAFFGSTEDYKESEIGKQFTHKKHIGGHCDAHLA